MNIQKVSLMALLSSLLLFSLSTSAGTLIYTPQNTAFGGNNASATQMLMSKAQAQDTTVDPEKNKPKVQKTEIERFQENLERRILDKIARDIVTNMFTNSTDDSSEGTGTFSTDQFSVTVDEENTDNVSITIVEYATGNETKIEIPKF
ncbi:MAG: hypothetical protein DSZ29_00515 [Aquificaceae bacterium]|nr:MAG: hypothetical protein DSZ29_00515 [Aquificaceae bacterium]